MPDYTKEINDISRYWKLINAQYAHDVPGHKAGETRTDGRYPSRIGSTYTCLSFLGADHTVIMPYIKNNAGAPKSGYVTTSNLVSVEKPQTTEDGKTILRFTTLNTVYTLESVKEFYE